MEKNKSRESDGFTEKIAPMKVNYEKKGVPEVFMAAYEGVLNVLLCEDTCSLSFKGRTTLHAASEGGHTQAIALLLKQGLPVDVMDEQGNTPLHLAVWCGQVEAVISLLKANANVNLPSKSGLTAIHYAACIGNKDMDKVLCDTGPNVNAVDSYGRTPLHYACLGVHSDTIRTLIRKKADLDVTDKSGKSPLDIVYEKDEFDLLTIMANNGADISKFYDEKWNTKLRKIKENEDTSETQNNVDFYGFLLREDSKPAPTQRNIKKKTYKKMESQYSVDTTRNTEKKEDPYNQKNI